MIVLLTRAEALLPLSTQSILSRPNQTYFNTHVQGFPEGQSSHADDLAPSTNLDEEGDANERLRNETGEYRYT